jgi:hypothetical protein
MNRREGGIMTQQRTDEQQQHGSGFEIKVVNKFDEDKRNIRVFHKKNDQVIEDEVVYHKVQPRQQQQQQEDEARPHERPFFLALEDSRDFLIIELGEEEDNFKKFTKDVYIELPFIADYRFCWKLGEGEGGKQVDRPITSITRYTALQEQDQTETGKTTIRIPGDQRAWKLEIMSPGNFPEHYSAISLNTNSLEMQGGGADNVSIGDNGPKI